MFRRRAGWHHDSAEDTPTKDLETWFAILVFWQEACSELLRHEQELLTQLASSKRLEQTAEINSRFAALVAGT
jgi:hypothetical protein